MSIDFGGGSKFTVDVGQLDGLIAGLEQAKGKVLEIGRLARDTASMRQPPSEEDYSRNAIRQIIERTVDDKEGTHTRANKAYADALDTMVRKLKAVRDQYLGTEGGNQSTFKPGG
ncbi:hypothetical protein N8J89_28380 [Crossiella sp. CA-258035]|uniref:hypothetical protein n=1 Tax=Crossiella sp. CA-258035 TaxID=2981138 RepID=UPI0024BC4C59|nr:hypothetical protein [Crossiella sp. CA-258035]WHT17031.1 hypothetical protein N8J89_28380 [Crossiella sp. CA-258035]